MRTIPNSWISVTNLLPPGLHSVIKTPKIFFISIKVNHPLLNAWNFGDLPKGLSLISLFLQISWNNAKRAWQNWKWSFKHFWNLAPFPPIIDRIVNFLQSTIYLYRELFMTLFMISLVLNTSQEYSLIGSNTTNLYLRYTEMFIFRVKKSISSWIHFSWTSVQTLKHCIDWAKKYI